MTMNKNFMLLMGVVVLTILTSAVMFRYQTTPSPLNVGYYYQTDRWTGTTLLCGTHDGCRERR
jgi:hypothetical protein